MRVFLAAGGSVTRCWFSAGYRYLLLAVEKKKKQLRVTGASVISTTHITTGQTMLSLHRDRSTSLHNQSGLIDTIDMLTINVRMVQK